MMGRQSLKGQATLPHAQLMSYPQASAPLAVLLIASKHSPRPASAVSKIGIVLFSRRPVGRRYGRARMIQDPCAQTWLGPISACGQNGCEGTIRTNLMGMGKEKSASCARLCCLCGTLTTRPIQAAFLRFLAHVGHDACFCTALRTSWVTALPDATFAWTWPNVIDGPPRSTAARHSKAKHLEFIRPTIEDPRNLCSPSPFKLVHTTYRTDLACRSGDSVL